MVALVVVAALTPGPPNFLQGYLAGGSPRWPLRRVLRMRKAGVVARGASRSRISAVVLFGKGGTSRVKVGKRWAAVLAVMALAA
jgi:hypothetical protein